VVLGSPSFLSGRFSAKSLFAGVSVLLGVNVVVVSDCDGRCRISREVIPRCFV
jgi:hypothetical protein